MRIAEVALNLKNRLLDKPYDYRVPDEAKEAERVVAPFGPYNREVEGFILRLKDSSDYKEDPEELKEISYFIDKSPVLDSRQMELFRHLKNSSGALYYTILSFFTSSVRTYRSRGGKRKAYEGKKEMYLYLKGQPKVRGSLQKKVIEELEKGALDYKSLKKRLPTLTKKTIERLEELGAVGVNMLTPSEAKEMGPMGKPVQESFLQEGASENPYAQLDGNAFGIAEGFEQVYKAVSTKLAQNSGQMVVLFPNSYAAREFHDFLSQTHEVEVELYTGKLGPKEKNAVYTGVKEGSAKVVVGSNAALFLPYRDLRTVVAVQVGDDLYCPSEEIRFDTIDTAEKLAEIWGAQFLALDRVDSVLARYKTELGKWKLGPVVETPLAERPRVVDISEFRGEESERIISDELKDSIKRSIDNGERSILLFNRKGYYNVHYCMDCGETLRCPECEAVLQSRRSGKEVFCRSCGYTAPFPESCPACGTGHLLKARFGIERVIEELRKLFPEALVSPCYSGQYEDTHDMADIIVGTKALLFMPDFESVTTVAAIFLDLDSNYPDYRSPEVAYRLYSEFFGRYPNARRFIQTRQIDERILTALSGDSNGFIADQAEYRKKSMLPPYGDFFVFTVTGPDAKTADRESEILRSRIESLMDVEDTRVLPVYRIRGEKGTSVRRFLVKSRKESGFREFLNRLSDEGEISAFASAVSVLQNPASYN